jgi:hypothetical protein
MKISISHLFLPSVSCIVLFPVAVLAAVQSNVGSLTFFDITESAEAPGGHAYSGKAQVVYFDESHNRFRLPSYHRLVVNLILPPAHTPDLCEYPLSTTHDEDEENTIDSFRNNNVGAEGLEFAFPPIALLVPLPRGSDSSNSTATTDDCDILTKIKVALRIQQEMITENRLWSVIFYNAQDIIDDSSENQDNLIYPMEIPENLTSNDIPGLDSLILASVSHRTGSLLLEQMERAASIGYGGAQDAPQYLLNEGNLGWQFPVSVERGPDEPFRFTQRDEHDDDDKNWSTHGILWIRYVVIAFFLCFPLIRYFRMWWMGGGRIRFRRNEQGHITGLVYQPPMANWYSLSTVSSSVLNNGNSGGAPRHEKLTKDQVLALPEIEYKSRDKLFYLLNDDDTTLGVPTESDSTSQLTKNSEASAISLHMDVGPDRESEDHSNGGSQPSDEEEGVAEITSAPAFPTEEICLTTTTSTMCSICLEEFEDGEMVRLLPHCSHGFHTDCILPWLTERQGCCPMCKTNVIESVIEFAPKEVQSENGLQSDIDEENQLQNVGVGSVEHGENQQQQQQDDGRREATV